MEPVRQFFTQTFVGVAQVLTPVLKESKFKETGVLTPEEFVAAGDHLVYRCPSWHWEKGDTVKDYLPADKQYLVTKNVPCYKRLKEVDVHTDDQEEVIELDDSGSGWVDTHHYMKHDDVCEGVSEMKIEGKPHKEKPHIVEDDDDDEEAVDMEELMKCGTVDDDITAVEDEQPDIILTRTYDLHITYDKYYQTPRLWLIGYNKSRHPLTIEEMYEDISQDHARKTVTVETHPHVNNNIPVATVHPCRHAEVMKRIIETAAEGGKELGVHLYLLIFLKFMQAVIPTIEYDFTQSFAF